MFAVEEGNAQYFIDNFGFDVGNKSNDIMLYENCEIKGADLMRLCSNVFLNDTIMNFYIKMLQKEYFPFFSEDVINNFYIFNTYFFPKVRQIVDKTISIYPEQNIFTSENFNILTKNLGESYPRLKKVFFL